MDLVWIAAALAFFATSGLAINLIGRLRGED